MSVLRSCVTAVAAAGLFLCAIAAAAGTEEPKGPSFLYFAGSDLWRDGAFLNGGMLWSPAGLDKSGFTLKLLLAGGTYVYPSGALRMDVQGILLSASALPGWRWSNGALTIGLYAGPIVQNYRLMPDDPSSRLRGRYAGGQIGTDIWYQPNLATMIAVDGAIASIGLIGSARAAFGWRTPEQFFVGPEVQALWCVDYQQFRLGAHVTGYRTDTLEWSASAGLAAESDRRGVVAPYLRVGVNVRY